VLIPKDARRSATFLSLTRVSSEEPTLRGRGDSRWVLMCRWWKGHAWLIEVAAIASLPATSDRLTHRLSLDSILLIYYGWLLLISLALRKHIKGLHIFRLILQIIALFHSVIQRWRPQPCTDIHLPRKALERLPYHGRLL